MIPNSTEQLSSADTERAQLILDKVGLSWDELDGKEVLDVASGDSDIAKTAVEQKSSAKVTSIDIKSHASWKTFPWDENPSPVQADAEKLPFGENQFDYAIMHGFGVDPLYIHETARVLKPGGELRIYPMGGQVLEYWYISYYLDKVQHLPQEYIEGLLQKYDQQIEEADGWTPNEYNQLLELSLKMLSQEQKVEVLDMMANRYAEAVGLPLSYEVDDPERHEPNARLIYKKP